MSAPQHPLSNVWDSVVEELSAMPECAALPRDEVIRFGQMMFFYGVVNACLSLMTLETMIKPGDDRERIRLNYLLKTAELLRERRCGNVQQMLATMKAHEVTA